MFLMLLTASQGLKIHTINIFKYQIFLTGFRWAKIFRHGATKIPIVDNPAKPISNDQLLLKKLRNNEKTLCSSLSYNIIPNKFRSFLSNWRFRGVVCCTIHGLNVLKGSYESITIKWSRKIEKEDCYSKLTSSERAWFRSWSTINFFTVVVGGVGQFPTTQYAEINAFGFVSR